MFLEAPSSLTARPSQPFFSSFSFRPSSRQVDSSWQQQPCPETEPSSPVPEIVSGLDEGVEASPGHSTGSNSSPVLDSVAEAEEEKSVTGVDLESSVNSCGRSFADYCDDENFVADPLYEDYESSSTALDETT